MDRISQIRYAPEPVGFAISEAEMRVLRTVILAVRFFALKRVFPERQDLS